MLIISRKRNEGVIINENIELTIVDIQGDKVRIGIDAPSSVKIVRKELLETANLNKEAAGIQSKPDVKKLKDILKNKGK